jgi:peptidyl-prolyl cis-trans isomerase C
MRSLVLMTTLLFACGESETETKSTSSDAKVERKVNGEQVATVNGVGIGADDFGILASRSTPEDGNALSLEERKEVLDKLVVEELLFQKALAKGYDQDPKVKKVMINALVRTEVYDSVKNSDFSDEELEAYFEEHKSEFTVPAKVQIYSLLVKVTDELSESDAKAKIERLHSQIKKDKSKFREIAKTESDSPYKRRGGDVGFVPKAGKPGLDQEMVDLAFDMKVETLSEPFKTTTGWNVIYIPAKREAKKRAFKDMKGSVLRKVKNERVKSMYDNYTGSLKTGVKVTIDEAKLQAVDVKTSKKPTLKMPNGAEIGK